MKKLIVILVSIFISINVYAATNPYKEKIRLCDTCDEITNCTWYAWKMAYENDGVALPMLNDAKEWYENARKAGYKVGTTPKAHSIVVWDEWSSYGHVGYVTAVNGNEISVKHSTGTCYKELTPEQQDMYMECLLTKTTCEEDSYLCDHLKYGEEIPCTYPATGGEHILGYIYLDEAPVVTPPPQTTTTTTKPVEIIKSSNNFLKTLEIKNVEVDFNKEVNNYQLTVEYDIEKIEINALAEDESSTINGTGLRQLKVGKNELEVKVIAEDGTENIYKIIINRKESDNTIVKEPIKEKKKEQKDIKKIIIKNSIYILSMIFLVIIFIVLLKMRKLKNKINL